MFHFNTEIIEEYNLNLSEILIFFVKYMLLHGFLYLSMLKRFSKLSDPKVIFFYEKKLKKNKEIIKSLCLWKKMGKRFITRLKFNWKLRKFFFFWKMSCTLLCTGYTPFKLFRHFMDQSQIPQLCYVMYFVKLLHDLHGS